MINKDQLFLEAIRGVLPIASGKKLEDDVLTKKITSTYKMLIKLAKHNKIYQNKELLK